MIIRYSDSSKFWRYLTLFILPKHKARVYNATDEEINELKKWLSDQKIWFFSNKIDYYSAKNADHAKSSKPLITIHIRDEEVLMGMKLAWEN